MDSGGVTLSFDALVAPVRCPPPARNHRRRTPGVDGVVAILVALAPLHLMSPLDGEMAASERSVHSARRVAV